MTFTLTECSNRIAIASQKSIMIMMIDDEIIKNQNEENRNRTNFPQKQNAKALSLKILTTVFREKSIH